MTPELIVARALIAQLFDTTRAPAFIGADRAIPSRPVASLWRQLGGSEVRAEQLDGGSAGPKSTPPMALNALSLIQDVTRYAATRLDLYLASARHDMITLLGAIGPDEPPAGHDTRDNLDRLATRLQAWPDSLKELANDLQHWINSAMVLLGNEPTRLLHIRGLRCMYCDAQHIWVTINNDRVQAPAINVVWGETRIIGLECAHCTKMVSISEWRKLSSYQQHDMTA